LTVEALNGPAVIIDRGVAVSEHGGGTVVGPEVEPRDEHAVGDERESDPEHQRGPAFASTSCPTWACSSRIASHLRSISSANSRSRCVKICGCIRLGSSEAQTTSRPSSKRTDAIVLPLVVANTSAL